MRTTMLHHRIAVYVPQYDKDGRELANDPVHQAEQWFADQFGGATSMMATGLFRNEAGVVIRERVTVVYAYVPPDDVTTAQTRVLRFACWACGEWRQQSVAVETPHGLILVAPENDRECIHAA